MNCIINAWHKHESELRGYLIRRLKNASLAEDLLQDTFVKAIAKGSGFCTLENPRSWLFKVVHNELVDHFRRHKIFIEFGDDIDDEEQEVPGVITLSVCLPRVLQLLTEDEREIITLCDLEGMNQADYAKYKQIGLSGTKSRIQRARRRLKNKLNEHCQVRFDEDGKVCCFVPDQSNGKK